MAFSWTSPQPLVPNTTMLGYYLSDIQDAINNLRWSLGKSIIPWQLSTTGIFYYAHINNLRLWIDSLIVDFGFTSVVDILGRNWSTYEIFIPYIQQYAAHYRIIQDFRDVLDFLTMKMEKWLVSTVISGLAPSRYFYGDLGLYGLAENYIDWYLPENVATGTTDLNPSTYLRLTLKNYVHYDAYVRPSTSFDLNEWFMNSYSYHTASEMYSSIRVEDMGKVNGGTKLNGIIRVQDNDKLYLHISDLSILSAWSWVSVTGRVGYPAFYQEWYTNPTFEFRFNFYAGNSRVNKYRIVVQFLYGVGTPGTSSINIDSNTITATIINNITGIGVFNVDIWSLLQTLPIEYRNSNELKYAVFKLNIAGGWSGSFSGGAYQESAPIALAGGREGLISVAIKAFGLAKNYVS